jgi:hypothetical protein
MYITAFSRGQRVRSRVDAQGLDKGQEYTLVDYSITPTPFGNFVYYIAESDSGERFTVANAHLLMEDATP